MQTRSSWESAERPNSDRRKQREAKKKLARLISETPHLLAAHMRSLCKSYVIRGSDKLLRAEREQVSDLGTHPAQGEPDDFTVEITFFGAPPTVEGLLEIQKQIQKYLLLLLEQHFSQVKQEQSDN